MIVRQESKCKRIKDSIYIVELSGFLIVKDFYFFLLYFLRSTTLHISRFHSEHRAMRLHFTMISGSLGWKFPETFSEMLNAFTHSLRPVLSVISLPMISFYCCLMQRAHRRGNFYSLHTT